MAANIVVNSSSDTSVDGDNNCTLREAINSANMNAITSACLAGDAGTDIISFTGEAAGSTIMLTQGALPIIVDSLAINGPVTIDANQQSRIFTNQSQLVLADLTLVNGQTLSGDATADDRSGGAILNDDGGTLTVTGGAMNNNTADRAGGAIEEASGAGNNGTDNVAVTLTGVSFSGNNAGAAPGNGGALHVTGSADVLVNGGTFTNNTAIEGGALWNNLGDMTLGGVSVVANDATGDDATQGGGGLFNETAASEGGDSGTLTIANSRIAMNTASGTAGSGGGILISPGATLTMIDSCMTGNTANRAGGAIENANGTVSLMRVTLGGTSGDLANNAGNNPGNGGGLHTGGAGTATITRSSVGYNVATEGAGLWNSATGTLNVDTSTIAFNSASDIGGGVYVDGAGGQTTLDFATLSNNNGTGIAAPNGGTVTLTDSLVAANDTNLDDNITASEDDGNVVTADASLGMYRLFGGPTATQPLLVGSLALDTNANCGDDDDNRDQRGAERPFDTIDSSDDDCDAGAFELTDDPVIAVTMNGADTQTVGQDRNNAVSVLGFTLTNNSEQAVTVGGFSGSIERDAQLPQDVDLAGADLVVYEDTNSNGQRDAGETQVATAEVDDNGSHFTVDFDNGAGASIPANDSMSYVVTASFNNSATTVAMASIGVPLLGGGALLALLGLASVGGVRRRTQLMLIVAALALTLTACSDDDNVNIANNANNGGGMDNGGDGGNDPMTAGQLQFVLETLDSTSDADSGDLVIGDGLPIAGPIVTFAVDDEDASN